ncbi:MAG: PLP-dependent transferase [Thermomicrobiales bacterium]|nr:PLP-dependent transferase [Thermomicrobiales bacterium]
MEDAGTTGHPAPGGARRSLGWATRAVHAGQRPPRPDFTPTAMPIYPSSAFVYDDSATLDAVFGNEREGYVYTRYGNPTTRAFEEAIAALEGTEDAVAFGSGMAAVYAALLLDARAGDRIVAAPDVYGASYAIFANLAPSLGIETVFADFRDLGELERTVRDVRPTLLFCETISNPLMRVVDLAAVARIAAAADARVAVDNTFATPYLVNPARFGIDSVVHSATKYLGGHGDATGGAIATSKERAGRLRELNKMIGAVLGPFESWLILRGMTTLPLRMHQHSANAARVAAWLADRPGIAHVNYPGLDDLGSVAAIFNGNERGGMISFDIAEASQDDAFRFLEALDLALPATTLGDVWSVVLYPAMSSHRALPPERRREIGIGDGLIRLSVGLEDAEDVIADLDQALTTVAMYRQAVV